MKQRVSPDIRQRVLDLRRRCSLSEVAERTGLPIGTVKTICSRSGSFRDNPKHRALFSLPPIRHSAQTLPAVVEVPEQQAVTGDQEIDAVLWLRQVISTGNAGLIEKAMEAAKRIKTPLEEIEKRYTKHLVSKSPGSLFAALSSFGFADLESLAKRSIDGRTLATEAEARFGDSLFDETPAEKFCVEALAGLKRDDRFAWLDEATVAERFKAYREFMPNTLGDCLHELNYWDDLYALRRSMCRDHDQGHEAYARETFAFECLAEIRPRNSQEAIDVFRYIAEKDCMGRKETNGILLNLIGHQ